MWFGLALWFATLNGVESGASDERTDARAREVIFGDDSRINVLDLRRETAGLTPQERYERLLGAVFPQGRHAIHIDMDFAPTNPAPPVIKGLGIQPDWISHHLEARDVRRQTGGVLISPAIDLVYAADEVGKLDDLHRLIKNRATKINPTLREQLALETVIAIAAQDFEAAREAIGSLRELAVEPVLHAERGPEAIAMWTGAAHPQTRDAARDLAFLVYEQARNNQGPRSERWHRQVYGLKHMLEWLAEQGNKSASSASREPLPHWRRVSRMTAETCGKGFPAARWDTRPGQVSHVTCHDHDYLYFVSPLLGDFEVEGDFTTFGYRDIHLAVGNVWAGAGYDLKACLNGDFRRENASLPIAPPLTRMFESMRVRAVMRNGVRSTYINGRKVFEAPHSQLGDPWVAIHSAWYANGSVQNLRVTGNPSIPEDVQLAAAPELPGWLPYYDESAGGDHGDWRLEYDSADSTQPVLVGKRRRELAGSYAESLLRYHRPVFEDGVISYEFFYRSDEIAVYPAFDRLCFILSEKGVSLHYLTDGKFDRTGLDPANVTPALRVGRDDQELPLRAGDWNQLQLIVRGDVLQIHLNGERIFTQEFDATNQRTFGLFHYLDQTEARVRNLHWRGEWPRELARPPKQQLADAHLERALDGVEELPVVFEHDFAEGLPLDRFYVIGGGWEDHVEERSDGLHMKRPGGNYARFELAPQVKLSGDFDITVAFADLRTSAAKGGEGNIQLLAALEDERSTECRVYRKYYCHTNSKTEQLAQAAVFQRRAGETDYSFPASPAEESTSGRMRLARRGSKVYFLYVEEDSSEFRLLHSQDVGAASTRHAGLRLVLESHQKESLSQVVWKSLTIRAASASGPLASQAPSVAQLDMQRGKLPAKSRVRFSTGDAETAVSYWGNRESFARDQRGMQVKAVGADHWTAAGVVSKFAIEGNFDVSLDLDVLHMETPAANSESTVYLHTGFAGVDQSAIEVKYSISPNGARAVEMQWNIKNPDGSIRYQELTTRKIDGVRQLRLARRDGIIYLLYQPSFAAVTQVLARAEVGKAAVPIESLQALVHTGGSNRTTVVRFRDLNVHAERILGPAVRRADD